MNAEKLLMVISQHSLWLNGRGGEGANLAGADLRRADLGGANLDFACWPLWCGSIDVKVDRRFAAQLAYHFCRVLCDDPGVVVAQNAILHLANTFHRAAECGGDIQAKAVTTCQ